MFDLIAIATTVSLLHDVAGLGQIVDDSLGAALGHTEIGCDVP
jgi:hypothetical protein